MIEAPKMPPPFNCFIDVERILARRVYKDLETGLEYLVHWKGFPIEHSTWENVQNLQNCLEKVYGFEYNQLHSELVQESLGVLKNEKSKKMIKEEEAKNIDQIVDSSVFDNEKGSYQAGDKPRKINSVYKDQKTGILMAKVAWKRKKGEKKSKNASDLSVDLIKQNDPELLIDYYESKIDTSF